MFLEAMLASEGLGPLSKDGWNIYRQDNQEQKGDVSPDTGLRTDVTLPIDREHPEAILGCIPTSRTVFCLLHAVARCVEKLLNLEIDNIISDANKTQTQGMDATSYIADKIHNLESNIGKRGVRAGIFRIHFDASYRQEPVSLTKHMPSLSSLTSLQTRKKFTHMCWSV